MKLMPILFTAIVIMIMIVVFISWTANLDKKETVDITAREYILKMETKGYLEPDDEQSLLDKLNHIGMKNVSLNGTTMMEVPYGDTIVLQIQGVLQIHNYTILNIFKVNSGSADVPIHIKKVSTAKQ